MPQVPQWITPSNLGVFGSTANFNTTPIDIVYQASNTSAISVQNGSWPQGITADTSINNIVVVTGQATTSGTSSITLRISDQGYVADRTYSIDINTIISAPSWTLQNSFIGYASSGSTQTFQVNAVVSGTNTITYGLVNPVWGMTIDHLTGIITYSPGVVYSNSTINFTVSATSQGVTSLETLSVGLVSPNSPPQWITPAGLILTQQRNQFIQYQLDAFATNGIVGYVVTGGSLPLGLTLSPSGLIYGLLPNVYSSTTYNFTVTATSAYQSTNQSFDIVVIPGELSAVFTWNNSNVNLGNINDGTIAVIDLSATSTRSNLIEYSIVGGQVPTGMVLDKTKGKLWGFVDYHIDQKTYVFEVRARDGFDNLTKTVEFVVIPSQMDQTLSVSIPLSGIPLTTAWNSDVAELIDTNVIEPHSDVLPRSVSKPMMNLISGLDSSQDQLSAIVQVLENNFRSISLNFGGIGNSNVQSDGTVVVWRNVIDPQSNSAIGTQSLNTWRSWLSQSRVWSNSGLGLGAGLIPVVDTSTGSISSVQVVERGSGYVFAPSLIFSGGTRPANVVLNLSLVSTRVINSSTGWNVGDQAKINYGKYTKPATIQVSEVNSLNQVVSFTIVDSGSYVRFVRDGVTVVSLSGSSAVIQAFMGIGSATVIDSGSGYSPNSTTISVVGSEVLPDWQSTWSSILPIATINSSSVNEVDVNAASNSSALIGQNWNINSLVVSRKGLTWDGDEHFDVGFDGGSTNFWDVRTPYDTIQDLNQLTLDKSSTVFDSLTPAELSVVSVWGSTVFDGGATIEDLFTTIFDLGSPLTKSITQIDQVFSFPNV